MRFRCLGLVSSFALMASLASPAFAQAGFEAEGGPGGPDEPTTGEVEDIAEEAVETTVGPRLTEIVVTAEFREANLQDTPIAITAMNAEMLEARGQTDIAQVAAQAPNVTLRPQGQANGSGLVAFIRGVGQTDFNFALEPGVGIYVDDVYYPTLTGSLLDLMDLERIEVLRGPQGTLAGKNSLGGAIKLYSRKPDGSGRGSLQATYGAFNRVDFRGFADFEVTQDLFARVAGVSKNRDGYVTRLDYGLTHPGSNFPSNQNQGMGPVNPALPLGCCVELGTLGGQSFAAVKGSLRWVPSPVLEINVSADYTNDSSESGANVLTYANAPATYIDVQNGQPVARPWVTDTQGNAVPLDCRFVPYGQYSCDTLSPSLGYDPRYVSYSTFLDDREPTSQAPYKPFYANPIQHFNGWGVQGNVQYDLGEDFQATWIGSWREYKSSWGDDADGSPIPSQQLFSTLEHRAWSQELRLNGDLFDGFFDFTLGGFYFDQDGLMKARVDLNYAGIDFIHGPDTTVSTSKAVFFNGTIHPTTMWTISAGLRRSWDEKTYRYFRSNPDGTVPNAPCEYFLGQTVGGPTSTGNAPNCLLFGLNDIADTFRGRRWDWRLVTDYRFSDALLGYASVSTGFKGGGVNPRPFFGPSSPFNQVQPFNPETLTTYEIGFKADLFGRILRLNGAGFFNKYEDIILTLSECPIAPCLQPNNVGSADVKGLELEVLAFPTEGLSLDAAVAYLDFQYTELTGPVQVTQDMITPYTPEFSYNFGAQYDYEISPGTISARIDGSYRSEIYSEAINDQFNHIDGYFLANGRLSFTTEDDSWQVALEVQNIFDKYYYLTKYAQPYSSGIVAAQPGLPRTWAVTVKRNFEGF